MVTKKKGKTMYYLIKNTLEACDLDTIRAVQTRKTPFVAVISSEEWKTNRECFHMEIDREIDLPTVMQTRSIMTHDVLIGNIYIPKFAYKDGVTGIFSFAINSKGAVFIDDSGIVEDITRDISENKHWRTPGLERCLYDILEHLIAQDMSKLGQTQNALEKVEDRILSGDSEPAMTGLNKLRKNLLEMESHYNQLIDLGEALVENENEMFDEDKVRYFHRFIGRVERLKEMVTNLKDYSATLRDLIQARTDVKQNNIMTILTVITAIFTPLTLITGWYGMNFKYMPELEYRWSYPVVILLSIAIVVSCVLYIKKKKWM